MELIKSPSVRCGEDGLSEDRRMRQQKEEGMTPGRSLMANTSGQSLEGHTPMWL